MHDSDSKPKDGGSAFPWAGADPDGSEGMTLRDYFAGQALMGMVVAAANISEDRYKPKPDQAVPISIIAYRIADAMLAERAK